MLASFALIFIFGLGLAQIASKLKLPRIVGMIAAGILIGPFALDLIDGSVLGISAELREIALVVILLRAGLSLDPSDLKRSGVRRFLCRLFRRCSRYSAIAWSRRGFSEKLLGGKR